MVIKIPTNSTATSLMAPQVKWFLRRISGFVVLNDKNAAARMITTSIKAGYVSFTSGLPPVKVHCSLLAEEAIHAALWDYAQKNGIKIEGLEQPKENIGEEEEEENY